MFNIVWVLLLVGCTRYIDVPYPVTNTIYSNTTIHNHTIEYVNVTTPCICDKNVTPINESPRYIIGLIQQLKRCEGSIARRINLSDCVEEMDKMNRSWTACNDDLEDIKELLD